MIRFIPSKRPMRVYVPDPVTVLAVEHLRKYVVAAAALSAVNTVLLIAALLGRL